MKNKIIFVSILILVLVSGFMPQPKPLLAIPLPEGRTLDEGHDLGYIDWSGSVNYADLFHRDGICPSGCTENITQISSGGTVSGAFAGEVSYFEVMLAYSGAGGFGTATIQACTSSYSVYLGTGGATPGFNSFSLSVPSGCTIWSVSASGGVVYFRSVDVNYSYIPPTATFTASPTETETPTPAATTTETPAASATPTDTPTETITPSPTLISIPTFTLVPGGTPSETPLPADISERPSSNGAWQLPAIPFLSFPSPTASRVPPTASIVPQSATPQSFSNVAISVPTLVCTTPIPSSASNSNLGSGFPNWLLPAGLTIASALALLNSFLKENAGGKTASLTPFGLAVPTPKIVYRKTTVGEWVTRPIRTLVQITRTIWKTITEAVPRFITRTRQVIDRIVRSEWVTTFRQIAKTFWEKVTEKVPLLGLFGKFLGFIWKTFIKPVVRWVTEATRTLRTWVENVIRTIVEKIQDGWNYITRQVSETIREWVEKTDWVRTWVTKEITVPEVVWEMSFFPILSLSNPATVRHLLQLSATVGLGAIALSQCTTPTPTPTPDVFATAQAQAWCNITQTVAAASTQTALAVTSTPAPTTASTPFQFPDKVFVANDQIYTCNDVHLFFGVSLEELLVANPGLDCNSVVIGVTQFNIPKPQLRPINEYVTQYNCQPEMGRPQCLSPNASAEEMIAYTLYNEGGSSEGNQFSANVMQVALNHVDKLIDNWGLNRDQMSRDDYARLVLYVISKPAEAGANVASFHAFSSPSQPPAQGSGEWAAALQIAQAALDNKGQNWGQSAPIQANDYIQSQDVLFYCSVRTPNSPPLGSTGQLPVQGVGVNGAITYLFNGYQYDNTVAQWCKDNK